MPQNATDQPAVTGCRSCLGKTRASLKAKTVAGFGTAFVERASNPGDYQQAETPAGPHSAGPHPVAIRPEARGQDLVCENEWAPSGIPHFRQPPSVTTNGPAPKAPFANLHSSAQVLNVGADPSDIQPMMAFAQADPNTSADDRAGKAETRSERAGIDGQVFARAGHPVPPPRPQLRK